MGGAGVGKTMALSTGAVERNAEGVEGGPKGEN